MVNDEILKLFSMDAFSKITYYGVLPICPDDNISKTNMVLITHASQQAALIGSIVGSIYAIAERIREDEKVQCPTFSEAEKVLNTRLRPFISSVITLLQQSIHDRPTPKQIIQNCHTTFFAQTLILTSEMVLDIHNTIVAISQLTVIRSKQYIVGDRMFD